MPARSYYSGRLHWTLTVSWAGRTFRWASSPLTIETEDGEALSFEDGLEPVDYEDSLQGLGVASLRSIPVEIHFPPEVDVAEWISQGHDLATATGEVSIWSEGTVWEERRVLLQGPVREPEYGGRDEPVSFSVEDSLRVDRSLVPSRSMVVSSETWPNPSEDALGVAYPIVWGQPGYLSKNNSSCAGSPCVVVHVAAGLATTVLIAGHRVESNTIILFNGDGQTYSFSVDTTVDDLGQIVSTVDLSVVSTGVFAREGSEYYASWIYGDALVDGGGEAVQTASDLVLYLLGQSTTSLDYPAWKSFSTPTVDGFIDEQVSPWEWVIDNLLPLFPLSVLPGPNGFYPVYWNLQAQRSEAVCTISPDEDPTVEREGRIVYSKLGDAVNSLVFDYAIDPQVSEPRYRASIAGDADADLGEVSSYYCAVSLGRYGAREETLDSDIVWSPATADAVLLLQTLRSALPSREVSYTVPYSYGWLRLGDVVLVSDAEVHLSDEIGLVTGLRWSREDEQSVRVLLLARPELNAGVSL